MAFARQRKGRESLFDLEFFDLLVSSGPMGLGVWAPEFLPGLSRWSIMRKHIRVWGRGFCRIRHVRYLTCSVGPAKPRRKALVLSELPRRMSMGERLENPSSTPTNHLVGTRLFYR